MNFFFLQTLDLIEKMCQKKFNLICLRLDGSTPLALRQNKVDEFNDIRSTKGGKKKKK